MAWACSVLDLGRYCRYAMARIRSSRRRRQHIRLTPPPARPSISPFAVAATASPPVLFAVAAASPPVPFAIRQPAGGGWGRLPERAEDGAGGQSEWRMGPAAGASGGRCRWLEQTEDGGRRRRRRGTKAWRLSQCLSWLQAMGHVIGDLMQ